MKIDWKPGPEGLRIATVIHPGFICPDDHPECAGNPPGHQHGRSGDKWIYVVGDGRFAVSFSLGTPFYRGERWPGRDFWAGEIQTHSRSQEHDEQPYFSACTFLDGGQCYSGIYGMAAESFWRTHGEEQLEQSESFWLALVRKWHALHPPDVVMAIITGDVDGCEAAS